MKLFTVLGFLGLTLGQAGYAGTEISGGGNAIVCRDGANKVISAELYDLYEGQIIFGLQYGHGSSSTNLNLETTLQQLLAVARREFFKEQLNNLVGRLSFLPSGVALDRSDDFGRGRGVVYPAGCRLEGIGYYEAQRLLLSTDVFKAMTPQHRAAFFLHEAIYKVARSGGEVDSELVREAVARLFAGDLSGIAKEPSLKRLILGPDQSAQELSVSASTERPRELTIEITPTNPAPYQAKIICGQDGKVKELFVVREKTGKLLHNLGLQSCDTITAGAFNAQETWGVYNKLMGTITLQYGEYRWTAKSAAAIHLIQPKELATFP